MPENAKFSDKIYSFRDNFSCWVLGVSLKFNFMFILYRCFIIFLLKIML